MATTRPTAPSGLGVPSGRTEVVREGGVSVVYVCRALDFVSGTQKRRAARTHVSLFL